MSSVNASKKVDYDGKASNLLKNAVMPVDFRFQTQVGGAVGYVAAEVAISWLFRRFMRYERMGLVSLARIHALSVPLIGGLQAPVESNHPLGYEAPMMDQFKAGAKGIPGLMAAVYVDQTIRVGLHKPTIRMNDLIPMSIAKIITRPLISMLYEYLPNTFINGLDTIEYMQKVQRANSRIISKDDVEFRERWS